MNLGLWTVSGMYFTLDGGFRVPYYDTTVDFALFESELFFNDFELGGRGG